MPGLSAAVREADRVTFCRMHHAATKVVAEAFMLTEEYDPDEGIPLWPTEGGES
jgi:hypothetical protein